MKKNKSNGFANSTAWGNSSGLQVVKAAIEFAQHSADGSENGIATALKSLRDIAQAETAFYVPIKEDLSFGTPIATDSSLAEAIFFQLIDNSINDLRDVAKAIVRGRTYEVLDAEYLKDDILRNALTQAGVRSFLCIGVGSADNLHGLMGLVAKDVKQSWPSDSVLLLRLVTSSFVPLLGQHKALSELGTLNERLDLALESSTDGWWDWNLETGELFISQAWADRLGYTPEHSEGMLHNWKQVVHPDEINDLEDVFNFLVKTQTSLDEFEQIVRMRINGDYRWIMIRFKAQRDESNNSKRLVGVELDITEKRLSEAQFKREKQSAAVTLDAIGDGVIATDTEGRIEYLNPMAESLTGWTSEEAAGKSIKQIFRVFHEETCEPVENPLLLSIRRKNKIKSIRPNLMVKRDGSEQFVESTAAPIRGANDQENILGGVLVFHDVTESRELNRRLSYHASHDILTGLMNRSEVERQVELTVQKAGKSSHFYAFSHINVDRFKMINDTCGHSAGDLLLSQIGALLKSKIRWRDHIARIGSDNFALITESGSLEEAKGIAEALRLAVNDFQFIWNERSYNTTISVGLVPITNSNMAVEEVLSTAESACNAAKESGRNRVYVYQENDLDVLRRKRELQWAARISTALDEGRFEIFRQHIHSIQEGDNLANLEHYELLLRMKDEKGKLISPNLFISAAERYGLISRIDCWVIRQTFQWLVSEADARERLGMCSINLSAQSMSDDQFLEFVIGQFEQTGLDPTRICFEITETAAMESYARALTFIETLKSLGCKFALDDFGTGHASFGYLKQFPVDFLKIDGSFVKGILSDPIDREMVRTINQIGQLTGKKTIAEFAENQEIIDMLKSLGVNYAQGFGISQPEQITQIARA